jgi:hypothetical protein
MRTTTPSGSYLGGIGRRARQLARPLSRPLRGLVRRVAATRPVATATRAVREGLTTIGHLWPSKPEEPRTAVAPEDVAAHVEEVAAANARRRSAVQPEGRTPHEDDFDDPRRRAPR